MLIRPLPKVRYNQAFFPWHARSCSACLVQHDNPPRQYCCLSGMTVADAPRGACHWSISARNAPDYGACCLQIASRAGAGTTAMISANVRHAACLHAAYTLRL